MPPKRPVHSPGPATYVAGTRATAPAALEESSDSAWQMFQELQRMHGQPVADDASASGAGSAAGSSPASAPGPGGGFEPTQPLPAARHQTARPPVPSVSLDVVMRLVRRNNRACPMPEHWAAFHKLLSARTAGSRRLPAPVDGAAWGMTSAMQKRLRLRDQIEWAEKEGALQVVFEFLLGLREEEWHHFG